jgi:hypothetical protein
VVSAWNDPEWIGTELDRLDRWRERWGFADAQYSYWAQLQARLIELDGRPHARRFFCAPETPSDTLAARPSII